MIRVLIAVVGLAMSAVALLSGCTVSVTHSVSASDLQNDISSKLEKAGQKPQSVSCKGDLDGTVGKSTDCDIVMSSTNTFEAHVIVTKVNGSTINYDTKPALTKEQLEQQVTQLLTQQSNDVKLQSTNCESGLEGVQGKTANCTVATAAGDSVKTLVTITSVDGLLMHFNVKEV